jgi:adenylate kinase
MAKSKEEQIFIGINDEVIELLGADKQAFLEQRSKDQAEIEAQKAIEEAQKDLKVSAYTKLGLTKEEIKAIL